MITYISGNLFESPAHVLVNTVNTVGVMGRGIAKTFKRIYPEMFSEYQVRCQNKKLQIGNLFLYKTNNKWILNFPTKRHWRNPSRPEYIERGLQKLVSIYSSIGIHDMAMPLIGCGNGELDWPSQVRPIVEKHLKNLPMHVFIYSYESSRLAVPEHRDIKSMKRWLRSEPEHLPISEVWDDLLQVLECKQEFQTLSGLGNRFRAYSSLDPPGIWISTASKRTLVKMSDILDLWHQIQSYGFTSRHIAPSGLSRNSSYLMPIFAELDYVAPAILSDSYERLHNGYQTRGLQYVPQPQLFQVEPHQFRFTP